MKTRFPIIIAISLFLGACGSINPQNTPVSNGYDDPPTGQFASNGEQIYFTATDQNGQRISYTGGPNFGNMMMGGYLTCASCHGSDGPGGIHTMHMQGRDAPPIYYDALVTMMQEESSDASQVDTYTVDDLRQTVVEGKHPDGDELKKNMPRWQMNDSDLADLLDFLKSLP